MMLLWKQGGKKMTLWNVWSPTVVQELIEVIKTVFKYYIVSKPQDNAKENLLLIYTVLSVI